MNSKTPKIPTNKLSVYLIKSEFKEHIDILKDIEKLNVTKIDGVGTFYHTRSNTSPPSWLDFFDGTLSCSKELLTATSKGILLTSVDLDSGKTGVFAIPFGYGRTFLLPGVWEERFGLKVVLNSIDPENLRKIDKKNLLYIPKVTSEQLSKPGVTADFGIDFDQDIIRSITGNSKEEFLGNNITGKDAISFSTKVNIWSIKDILKACYKKFESNDYKENFGWIDQILDIRDPNVLKRLNKKLIKNLVNKKFDKTWMAVPELINWPEIKGFGYKKNSRDLYEDISLTGFLNSLSEEKRINLNIETLKKKRVYSFSTKNDMPIHVWNAFKCIYSEQQDNNNSYLLSNGNWYELEKSFVKEVNHEYKEALREDYAFNLPAYNHKNENDYNEKVSMEIPEFCCMDNKIITHGGGKSKIEFCDLFTNDKKIFHVKKYAGSTVLSHLFAQGAISGELFIRDPEFRIKVNTNLSSSHKFDNANEKPIASEYQIIFAIISSSASDLELPFFSKVSFRNVKYLLEAFGFKVALQKVMVEGNGNLNLNQ